MLKVMRYGLKESGFTYSNVGKSFRSKKQFHQTSLFLNRGFEILLVRLFDIKQIYLEIIIVFNLVIKQKRQTCRIFSAGDF
jgi:hypothetical protein